MFAELFDKYKMKETIQRKGNLSAPGLDKLTYPILKYNIDSATDLMIKIMTMMLRLQKCPEAWKEGKVVMLPKPCKKSEKNKPENWRPITLTNICYRIVFGRIADYFQEMHKKKTFDGDAFVCKEQKEFIRNINGCCEHSAKLNYLITDAVYNKKKLYLAALDCKDAFGSVSHQLMDINMNNLGVPSKLKNLIMDSYKNTTVRIWSCGTASNPVDIREGVKQGCPLSPLLFDLCVDPLITLIKKHKEDGYTAEGLETATIQAYADEMILISNS
jgi:hypothetical protein